MEEELESRVLKFLNSIQTFSWAFTNLIGQDAPKAWTPTLTFATPGNLSVTYSQRVGRITKLGPLTLATFNLVTSAFTHTSASGNLQITGLPFTTVNVTNLTGEGTVRWTGITKANYTQVNPGVSPNSSTIVFVASGSGQAFSNVAAADMPTGGTVALHGALVMWTKQQ